MRAIPHSKLSIDRIPLLVEIGNCSGRDVNKFRQFNLTSLPSEKVRAPLIKECYANFECKLIDSSLIGKYNLFVLEVQKAHVAISPQFPKTIHYRGDGKEISQVFQTGKFVK